MATQVLSQPRFAWNVYGRQPIEIGAPDPLTQPWVIETAAQTYKANDLVYTDANGTIAIAQVTSNKLVAPILGFAKKDASGVTGAQTRVRVILPGDVYMMNLYHTTPASAVGTAATVGLRKGVWQVSTSLLWTVDLVTSVEGSGDAGAAVKVIGYPSRGFDGAANTITDIYAVVYVQFLKASFAGTGTWKYLEVLQYDS